jgi:hypothetical protein
MTRTGRIKASSGRLGSYSKHGTIYVNPRIPKTYKGISMRSRVRTHEKVEYAERQKGASYKKAHKIALKAEHKNLTKTQVRQYEGKLGSISASKRR